MRTRDTFLLRNTFFLLAAWGVLASLGAARADQPAALLRQTWTPRPAWLGNASARPAVTLADGGLEFRIPEPRQGMKWSTPVRRLWLRDFPVLVLRYRARNLDTANRDYAIYLDDGDHSRQLSPVRLGDLLSDDRPHTLAVDLSAMTQAETALLLAVQVQAGAKGDALLRIERLEFLESAPPEATLLAGPSGLSPARPAADDQSLPLPALTWTAQPSWLGNPAPAGRFDAPPPLGAPASASRPAGAGAVFRVLAPTAGMKWSASLPAGLELGRHRYLALRYRARGLSQYGDYALALLGRPRPSAKDAYVAVVMPGDLQADGRWHTLAADLRGPCDSLSHVTGLACQVQAGPQAHAASLEIADIRLTNAAPASALADACDLSDRADWAGFAPLPLGPAAAVSLDDTLARLRLTGWPAVPAATFQGVPFELARSARKLAVTPLAEPGEIALPADARASEVCLLALARMVGPEEDVYGGGPLHRVEQVDRFRVRLEYADGAADECFPLSAAASEFALRPGLNVLVAPADPARTLRRIVVREESEQIALALAAVTLRTGPALFPAAADNPPPLVHRPPPAPALAPRPAEPGITLDKTHALLAGGALEAALPLSGPPRLARLRHLRAGRDLLAQPCPLLTVELDGTPVLPEDWLFVRAEPGASPAGRSLALHYALRGREGLTVTLTLTLAGPAGDTLALAAGVRNGSAAARRAKPTLRVGPYRLADRSEDELYFFPKRGSALSAAPCRYRARYCGTFPLQFVDTFAPSAGCGLCLRTGETEPALRHYLLEKSASGLSVGLEHPETPLPPGSARDFPPVLLRLTDGHWRRGLDDYAAWRRAAMGEPASPRKPWFREVFNFRQRFLHWLDPLYDARSGRLELQRAVDEAREQFGGIDYLHLFDWGNLAPYGRIYSRTGDHDCFASLAGGAEALRDAMASVRKQGIPVGLYIEGYLLEEKGKLAQQSGQAWQMIGPSGQGVRWPNSSEIYVCAGVEGWQAVQETTYADKVARLHADGMYIDQFGFAGSYVDCWSKDHGHGVPSYSVLTERDCTRRIRRAVDAARAAVAVYTEETPVDATALLQDGSFTYAMNEARRTASLVPLNAARFAMPDFKTIEILVCDKPTASWAQGVKWVFFNGEAIWLEGPADDWFAPRTRETIRRTYRILREHRDAFTSLAPVPLTETLAGGIYANAFPAPDGKKTVYTFYNARRQTFRGEVLALPAREGNLTAHDAWNNRPAQTRTDGGKTILRLEIGPCDVGCVVVGP